MCSWAEAVEVVSGPSPDLASTGGLGHAALPSYLGIPGGVVVGSSRSMLHHSSHRV